MPREQLTKEEIFKRRRRRKFKDVIDNTKFEKWNIKGKKRIVIVKRNEKKRIESWRFKKGSKIKTINEARKLYLSNGTFKKDIVKIGKSKTKINNIISVSDVGLKTKAILSKSKPKDDNGLYQYIAYITWELGQGIQVTIGYSNLVNRERRKLPKGTKRQAFDRAVGEAVSRGLITYEYVLNWASDSRGYYEFNDKKVWFKVNYNVQTFLNAN